MNHQAQMQDALNQALEQDNRGNLALLRLVLCVAVAMSMLGVATQVLAGA